MKELKDLKLKYKTSLKGLNLESLKKELKDSESKFFVLRMKLATDELKQTHLIKFIRRYIARIKSIILEKTV